MEIYERHSKSVDSDRPLSRSGIGIGAIGLGDAIRALTKMFGVKPCAKCEKRAEKLNTIFSIRIKGKKRL